MCGPDHEELFCHQLNMIFMLETDRLQLRTFQDGDIQDFAAYRSDPLIAKYQGWDAPFSLEQAVNFVEEMKHIRPGTSGQWCQLAIELKKDRCLIGDCAFLINADSQQAEIGVTLARSYHGRGLATEAVSKLFDYLFDDLCLHRVQAICDVDNLASSKLLERVGMRREAHFVDHYWFNGEWRSEYVYGLLRHEWTNSSQ